MELDFAILAERASLVQDRFFIHGGGWVAVQVPAIPWPVSLALAARFTGDREEAGEERTLAVSLHRPDDEPIEVGTFPVTLPPDPTDDAEVLVANWLLEITNIPLESEGWYAFELRLGAEDGDDVHRIRFRLMRAQNTGGEELREL